MFIECEFELVPGTVADYRCRACQRTVPNVKALPVRAQCRGGIAWMGRVSPGRALARIIGGVGLYERTGCGCKALAAKMDAWGIEGCAGPHRQEIVDHLNEAARDVPWPDRLRAGRRLLLELGIVLNPFDPAGSLLDHALRRAKRKPLELCFTLPPGIGDCSWVYSKIGCLAEARGVAVRVASSGLPRALDFVRLLPDVEVLGWGSSWNDHSEFVDFDVDLVGLSPGEYNLFVNPHLEDGRKLADAWPKQRTDYHYAIETTPAMKARARQILERGEPPRHQDTKTKNVFSSLVPSCLGGSFDSSDPPTVGFYCSSGRRDDRWQHFWRSPQWLELLEGAAELVGPVRFVAIAASYDERTAGVAAELRRRGHQVAECIGCHIGVTVEVIRRLSYFFAYPSGLGILGDVLNVPTMMWYWPAHHDLFLDSYADPANVSSGRHLNLLFDTPASALKVFEERGLRWVRS